MLFIHLHVDPVCFSKQELLTHCVNGNCFFNTLSPLSNEMVRYGYHFAKQHQITLRCTKADTQMPHTLPLEGTGLLHNLSGCHVSSPGHHAFLELHVTNYAQSWSSDILPTRHLCTQRSWTRAAKRYTIAESLKKKLDGIYNWFTASRHNWTRFYMSSRLRFFKKDEQIGL